MVDQRIAEHSYAYGTYLAAMTAGLIAAGAWGYGALYALMFGSLIWLTQRRVGAPTWRNLTTELAFFAVTMNVSFQAMAGAIPAIREQRYDALLLGLESRLVGGSVNVWAERFVTPAATEFLSACYLIFFPLLLVSLLRYFFRQKELLANFYRGLFTVYGIGFLGYALVPASGPWLAYPELFGVALDGGPITRLNQAIVVAGSNGVDVFPSLHCAVTAYILGFARRHHPREFRWLLVPVAGLWCSTIYLRYHYLVDVLCGFLLAALALSITRRRPVAVPAG